MVFVALITMIGYFQLFAEPYVMTQGGPAESTLSVVLLMYEEGFRWWNVGYGAAIAFVLFAIVLVLTVVQLRLRRQDAAVAPAAGGPAGGGSCRPSRANRGSPALRAPPPPPPPRLGPPPS